MRPLTALALPGSLRKASTNKAMLAMAVDCAPPGLHITVYPGLGDLPLFNPYLETSEPGAVAHLRRDVAGVNALLVASAEYAPGVSSPMKNALDGMVSKGVSIAIPVMT